MSRENDVVKTKSMISNERESYETCYTSQTSMNNVTESQQQKDSRADNLWATFPRKLKPIALMSVMLLSIGSSYAEGMISAMKSTMIKVNILSAMALLGMTFDSLLYRQALKIDNTRYGVLAAADVLISTLLPMVGGFLIDSYSPAYGTLAANTCVLVGSLLTAIGTHFGSFAITLAGRAVFGLGSGQILTMQQSLLAKWFRTRHFSTAVGLLFALNQLAIFLGIVVSGAINHRPENWVWPFWLSVIVCGFALIMNIVYALVHKHLSTPAATKSRFSKPETIRTSHWRAITRLRIFYWYIILLNFILAGVWISFRTLSTNLVQVQYGASQDKAAYIASVGIAIPIVLTPVVGRVLDCYGRRITILMISSVILILSCALLGWTHINPLVGMILYSIATALGPLCILTSVGVLMPSAYVGIGLGIEKCSMNIGTLVMNIVVGIVQDHTPGNLYTAYCYRQFFGYISDFASIMFYKLVARKAISG